MLGLSSFLTERGVLHQNDQPGNPVYCKNHTKHINTLSGQTAGFLVLNLVVHIYH
jgi:hypothetical protein